MVGYTAYHDTDGTFQDVISVTYRNDTDTSQQMWIAQSFSAYAGTSPVPEPSGWLMLGIGALVAARFGRQRQA
ncbi:PEP-CTERM sorting domain-containing protein [[Empedobacter] haloabium]|uniref:PEP-CTERM sorting domain-containing protein n=1 Tax=[Empedobacter] haloabium TaxID=592317 RepID=A0ABZ1UQ01_9BURK